MNKILCPWCKQEIEIRICDAEGNIPLDQDTYKKNPWSGLFYCLYHPDKMDHPCPIATFKDEPLGKNLYDSEDEAYAAAIRRPLQKPLTLKEACESEEPCVYMETIDSDAIEAVRVIEDGKNAYGETTYCTYMLDDDNLNWEAERRYGKTWRCWATKPSEEERSAAKWEEL